MSSPVSTATVARPAPAGSRLLALAAGTAVLIAAAVLLTATRPSHPPVIGRAHGELTGGLSARQRTAALSVTRRFLAGYLPDLEGASVPPPQATSLLAAKLASGARSVSPAERTAGLRVVALEASKDTRGVLVVASLTTGGGLRFSLTIHLTATVEGLRVDRVGGAG